jgi:hypothetical protein
VTATLTGSPGESDSDRATASPAAAPGRIAAAGFRPASLSPAAGQGRLGPSAREPELRTPSRSLGGTPRRLPMMIGYRGTTSYTVTGLHKLTRKFLAIPTGPAAQALARAATACRPGPAMAGGPARAPSQPRRPASDSHGGLGVTGAAGPSQA